MNNQENRNQEPNQELDNDNLKNSTETNFESNRFESNTIKERIKNLNQNLRQRISGIRETVGVKLNKAKEQISKARYDSILSSFNESGPEELATFAQKIEAMGGGEDVKKFTADIFEEVKRITAQGIIKNEDPLRRLTKNIKAFKMVGKEIANEIKTNTKEKVYQAYNTSKEKVENAKNYSSEGLKNLWSIADDRICNTWAGLKYRYNKVNQKVNNVKENIEVNFANKVYQFNKKIQNKINQKYNNNPDNLTIEVDYTVVSKEKNNQNNTTNETTKVQNTAETNPENPSTFPIHRLYF
jgi:hypothetical protein